jgi:hypothetical protein
MYLTKALNSRKKWVSDPYAIGLSYIRNPEYGRNPGAVTICAGRRIIYFDDIILITTIRTAFQYLVGVDNGRTVGLKGGCNQIITDKGLLGI